MEIQGKMLRNIDFEKEIRRITEFIRSYYHTAGFTKAVIGLSGGLDSSVSAALAACALGAQNVIGFAMPHSSSSHESLQHATDLAQDLGIQLRVIPISPWVDPYFNAYAPDSSRLRMGNWMARARMCVLFDQAVANQALVMGTGNRSELLIGYFTQNGDNACAIEPLGHLYKTEVKMIAQMLSLPSQIIDKAPSADLWQGQTDKDEIGVDYDVMDQILCDITEKSQLDYDPALPYSEQDYLLVKKLYTGSAFKRISPPMPEPPCSK